MPKYPEHIDQLDNFYQSELANVEVLPPADMWDRISASLEDERNKKGGSSTFTNNQKSIGIVALIVLIGVSASVYYMNQESEPNNKSSLPVINTPRTDNTTTPKNESTDQLINNTTTNTSRSQKSKDTKSINYTPAENNSVVEEPLNTEYQIQPSVEPKAEVIEVAPVEKQEEPVEKAAKKKVSFKDKHKQGYQDSTRNLFVPGK